MTNQSGQRNAQIRCSKTMCGEMNCLDCYPLDLPNQSGQREDELPLSCPRCASNNKGYRATCYDGYGQWPCVNEWHDAISQPLPLPEKGETTWCVYCGEKTTKHAPGEHKLWPSEPPVERPELPALEINADDRDEANKDLRMMAVSRRNLGNTLAALVCRERQLLECKAELLAALSRINQLEKDATEVVWIYECDKCAWIANPEHLGQRCRKCGGTCIRYATSAIGERQNVYFSNVYRREQLRAEKAESERDQLQLKLDAALAKTNTPEWFDTPCARAVREVVGDK